MSCSSSLTVKVYSVRVDTNRQGDEEAFLRCVSRRFFVSRPGEGFLLLGSAYERHLLRAMFPVWRDHVVVVYATIMKDDEVK